MSISPLVTRGFGTFGSIAFVVTGGYVSGAVPPPPPVVPSVQSSYNIIKPNWVPPSPKYQYEFTPLPFSAGQTIVPVPNNANPTQSAPPLPPVANTDTGGLP